MKLYPEPEMIIYGKENVDIPLNFQLDFHGGLSHSFQENMFLIFKQFSKEELEPLLRGEHSGRSMKCLLIRDNKPFSKEIKKFIPPRKVSDSNEGFSISLENDMIKITGTEEQGIIQGVHTLLELFRNNAYHGTIKSCSLQDGPFVPVRGVHMYLPAREDIPFYKRFVSRFLAPMHYNIVFLEVGGGMRFDRHPEINTGWEKFTKWVFEHHKRPFGPEGRFQDSAHAELAGGSFLEKDEVCSLVEWTRAYGMEVIPEIQSLSHSYYLTAGHPEIAELSDALWPDAYCPSNPDSRKILFDVLEEYIETIRPGMIHIGHDEWRVPALCPKCRGHAPELFARDICEIHNYLERKNIGTAMWADGLLPICDGKATYTCIDAIPREILLLHWNWWCREFQERLSLRGFKMILGNFSNLLQGDEWRQIAHDPNVLGAEVSSWVGMNRERFAVDGTVWHMLSGANYLWNGKKTDMENMYWLSSEYLPQISSRLNEFPHISCLNGTTACSVDISSILNVTSCVKTGNVKWNLDPLIPGKGKWRKIIYEIPNPWTHNHKKGVAVSDARNELNKENTGSVFGLEETVSGEQLFLPETIVIEIGKKVKGFVFFHFSSATGKRKNAPYQTVDEKNPLEWTEFLGYYQINYASGIVEHIDLHNGLNIDTLSCFIEDETKFPLLDVPPAVRIDSLSGFPSGALGGFEWRNFRADDEILSVSLHAGKNSFGIIPVLIALSILK